MKKVIIVGAGIAGMTAGIYALQSGFEATMLEQHSIPGGLCTSWKRNGYLFEGGLHWLTGSAENQPIHKLWHEVGAINAKTIMHNRDPFVVCDYFGKKVFLYRDIKKTEAHLCDIAPEDTKAIKKLCKDAIAFSSMPMPVTNISKVRMKEKEKSLMTFGAFLKMIPAIMRIFSLGKISVTEYTKRFKNPAIRMLLLQMSLGDYAAIALACAIGGILDGDGGYFEGGSLQMAKGMENRFKELGGIIQYGTKVEKVIIENGRATGIVVNGISTFADAIIVASDTRIAIDTLFNPPIQEKWAEKMRISIKPITCTFVSLGVETNLFDMPESMAYSLEQPITFAKEEIKYLTFNNYARYSSYAPEGCTAVTTVLPGNHEYWKAAKADGSYLQKKKDIAERVIAKMEEKIPETKGKVKVWDVATPLTYERYCGTYHGSWMTLLQAGQKMISYPCKPAGIENLYFAGQRITPPGGMPIALETGRHAVQYLCRDHDMVFQGREV